MVVRRRPDTILPCTLTPTWVSRVNNICQAWNTKVMSMKVAICHFLLLLSKTKGTSEVTPGKVLSNHWHKSSTLPRR